jgi:hypothetical protein
MKNKNKQTQEIASTSNGYSTCTQGPGKIDEMTDEQSLMSGGEEFDSQPTETEDQSPEEPEIAVTKNIDVVSSSS